MQIYTAEEITEMMLQVGFVDIETHQKTESQHICVIGWKSEIETENNK